MDGLRLAAGRPLLGVSGRNRAGALACACVLVVAVLGMLFAHQTRADWLDNAIDSPIIAWLGGRAVLAWLAFPGTLLPAVVFSATIAIACLLAGRLNGAILAVAAVPAATAVGDGLIKHLVHRTYLGQLAYPSGHTTAVSALAATVTVLLLVPPHPATARVLRIMIPVLACALGAVTAMAVIALRWHYFPDTGAGAAVGTGTVCALALILDLPAARRLLARVGKMAAPRAAGGFARICRLCSTPRRPMMRNFRALRKIGCQFPAPFFPEGPDFPRG